MVKYKCGHDTNGVIVVDNNMLSYIAYEDWANNVGLFGDKSLCWECYNNQKEVKI